MKFNYFNMRHYTKLTQLHLPYTHNQYSFCEAKLIVSDNRTKLHTKRLYNINIIVLDYFRASKIDSCPVHHIKHSLPPNKNVFITQLKKAITKEFNRLASLGVWQKTLSIKYSCLINILKKERVCLSVPHFQSFSLVLST